jgi:hypothetical protein
MGNGIYFKIAKVWGSSQVNLDKNQINWCFLCYVKFHLKMIVENNDLVGV